MGNRNSIKIGSDEHKLCYYIGDVETGTHGVISGIKSAIVSKTEQRTGSSEQLNARTFFIDDNTTAELSVGYQAIMDSIVVGSNFIKGYFDMNMTGQRPFEEPENVNVKGWFTAVRNYDD